MRTGTTNGFIAAIAALSLGHVPATGQNALGDGRVLDNNLSTQSRLNQARPDFQAELDFRNAIALGQAPGGLSFRGDIGYGGSEFRDTFNTPGLGDFRTAFSDFDQFAFRRDSFTSGLAGRGIRGTEALQFQTALTTGSRPPSNLVGSFQVLPEGDRVATSAQFTGRRAGSGFNTDPGGRNDLPGTGLPTLRQRSPDDPDADRRGNLLSIRSPSSYLTNERFQPVLLGTSQPSQDGGVRHGLSASTLRGVQLVPLADMTARQDVDGSPVNDPNARSQRPPAQRPARPGLEGEDGELDLAQRGISGRAQSNRVDPDQFASARVDNRVESMNRSSRRIEGAYESLLQDLALSLQDEEDADEDAEGLPGFEAPEQVVGMVSAYLQGFTPTPLPGDQQPEDDAQEADDEAAEATEEDPLKRFNRLSERSVEILREMRDRRETLVRSSLVERNDAFAVHMAAGERLLKRGQYLDAEKRFASALTLKQGDVMAQIGRLHAQLGAGAFMGAAVNLRELLLSRPEIIPARYDESLLPPEERLRKVKVDLRDLSEEGAGSGALSREAPLLLAYLAYQTEDRAEGLWALRRFEQAVQQGAGEREGPDPRTRRDRRLLNLLKAVWFDEDLPQESRPEPGKPDAGTQGEETSDDGGG